MMIPSDGFAIIGRPWHTWARVNTKPLKDEVTICFCCHAHPASLLRNGTIFECELHSEFVGTQCFALINR